MISAEAVRSLPFGRKIGARMDSEHRGKQKKVHKQNKMVHKQKKVVHKQKEVVHTQWAEESRGDWNPNGNAPAVRLMHKQKKAEDQEVTGTQMETHRI